MREDVLVVMSHFLYGKKGRSRDDMSKLKRSVEGKKVGNYEDVSDHLKGYFSKELR